MIHKQLKDKIQSIRQTINSLNSVDLVQKITYSQKKVNDIIGKNQIEKLNHSSLLKYIIYELMIFIGQKHAIYQKHLAELLNSSPLNLQQKLLKSIDRVKQIKSLLNSISRNKNESTSQITIDVYDFKSLVRKFNILEEYLYQQGNLSKEQTENPADTEGMELMIEQLESLLKKKQNRIRELNTQLQQSAFDKNELEQQIYSLQNKNKTLEKNNQLLRQELSKMISQLERFESCKKQKLSFQGFDMVGSQITINKNEKNISQSTITQQNQQQFVWNCLLAQNSNQNLQKCQSPSVHRSQFKQNKLKKRYSHVDCKEDPDAVTVAKQLSLKASDTFIDRLILMQALVIEHTLQNVLD